MISATVKDVEDAQKVINSINDCIKSGKAPTPEKVELCEQYIVDLFDLGLAAFSLAVECALNNWCELLLDA
ncbi:hypothetical protein [Idiomarina abyssalis]|uniref:hypothetical protein n=1 Tax=Idiomarina abyssalis TaxID=86102 RepID=UPI003A901191